MLLVIKGGLHRVVFLLEMRLSSRLIKLCVLKSLVVEVVYIEVLVLIRFL